MHFYAVNNNTKLISPLFFIIFIIFFTNRPYIYITDKIKGELNGQTQIALNQGRIFKSG